MSETLAHCCNISYVRFAPYNKDLYDKAHSARTPGPYRIPHRRISNVQQPNHTNYKKVESAKEPLKKEIKPKSIIKKPQSNEHKIPQSIKFDEKSDESDYDDIDKLKQDLVSILNGVSLSDL